VCVCVCVCVCARALAYIYAYICIYTHAHMHICICNAKRGCGCSAYQQVLHACYMRRRIRTTHDTHESRDMQGIPEFSPLFVAIIFTARGCVLCLEGEPLLFGLQSELGFVALILTTRGCVLCLAGEPLEEAHHIKQVKPNKTQFRL
jgi:hypothetical protein